VSYFVTRQELDAQREHIFNAMSAIIIELENKFLKRIKELEEKIEKEREKEQERK